MKINRSFFLATAALLVVLTFAACGFGGSDRPLESAFSKDSSMVFVIDNTSDQQAASLTKVIDQFPATGLLGEAKQFFDNKLKGENLSWDQDVAPILAGKWKIGFSLDLSKKVGVFAGKFAGSNQIPVLLNKLIADGTGFWKSVKYEKNGGVEYWTEDLNGIYLALDRDILIVAKSDDDRKIAVKSVDDDNGLDQNSEFKDYTAKSAGRLAYVYVGNIAGFVGGRAGNLMEAFVEAIVVEDGFKIFRTTNFDPKGDAVKTFMLNPDYKISLADKVNSKGLFFYTESSNFEDGILGELVRGLNDGVTATYIEKVKFLLNSPHAIAISDKGNYLPAIALYFQLKNEDAVQAKQLLTDFDGYVDQVILEINKADPAVQGQASFIKKDVVAVSGGALHKVYVDWKAVPESLISEWSAKSGIDVTSVKNEFYYGLMGDNVFVVAWYPNFPAIYGQEVLSQNADYQDAFKQLDSGYGMSVTYVNTKSLVSFADEFLKMVVTMDGGTDADKALTLGYADLAKKIMGTIKFYVASSGYKDGQISAESFVKVAK